MGEPEPAGARATRVTDVFWQVVAHPIVLVGLGGAAGSVLRYYLGRWIDVQAGGSGFPWGTFAINVSGSFILGVVGLLVTERLPPEYRWAYLLFGTGFCGGFTTFSTFEWETFKLIRDGSVWLAVANVVGSVVAGMLGVVLAVAAVSALWARPAA